MDGMPMGLFQCTVTDLAEKTDRQTDRQTDRHGDSPPGQPDPCCFLR